MPPLETLQQFRAGPGEALETLAQFRPGETPEDALQEAHPDVSFIDRFRIKFRGGAPGAGQRLLEEKGFETQSLGGSQYAIRKPGESQWRLLDKPGAELEDVTDVAGDVLSLGGTIGGGIAGAPGGIAGGAAGAALGSAGAGALRQLLSGLPAETGGAAAGELATEAVTGATAELGGRALGGIARGLGGLSRAGRQAGARAIAPREISQAAPAFGRGYPRVGAGQRRLGEMIGRAGEALSRPQEAIGGFAGRLGMGGLGGLLRGRLAAGAGIATGSPVLGAIGAAGLAGKGLGRISRHLMSDTSGRPLLSLLGKAVGPVAQRIERALQLAGNPETRMAYRAAIFQLLHDPEFRRLFRENQEEE